MVVSLATGVCTSALSRRRVAHGSARWVGLCYGSRRTTPGSGRRRPAPCRNPCPPPTPVPGGQPDREAHRRTSDAGPDPGLAPGAARRRLPGDPGPHRIGSIPRPRVWPGRRIGRLRRSEDAHARRGRLRPGDRGRGGPRPRRPRACAAICATARPSAFAPTRSTTCAPPTSSSTSSIRSTTSVRLPGCCRRDGRAFFITPNEPADFENPYHVYLFDPDDLRSMLGRHFASVRSSGSTPRPIVKADFEKRRAMANKLLKLDPFGLRHKLPREAFVCAPRHRASGRLPVHQHRAGRRTIGHHRRGVLPHRRTSTSRPWCCSPCANNRSDPR